MDTHEQQKVSPFFFVSQVLEKAASKNDYLISAYYHLVYKKKLKKELKMAQLKEGASILHIGCGPCPYTALSLAEHGFKVTAVDCVEEAVDKAEKLVERKGLENVVKIVHEDGGELSCSGYDAVWVSLNVYPKREVLERAFRTMQKGAVLIYRNVPQWLSGRYELIPKETWENSDTRAALSNLGAQSVMVRKRFRI